MKYCPLCLSEYRDYASVCGTCSAALVASLDSEPVRSNAPRLLWIGRNFDEFDLISGVLQDIHVPARMQRAFGGLVGSLTHAESTIHVLSSDFERALEAASASIEKHEFASAPKQICYACSTACSACLTVCPRCKVQLIAEPVRESESATANLRSEVLQYCPVCSAEYSAGHTQCTICGVNLVPEKLRGRPLDERQRKERIELAWRGGDPVAVSEAVHILRDAGIRHHVQPTNDHLVFELGMPRPKYAVRVFASDVAEAKELLKDIRESAPLAPSYTSNLEEKREPPRSGHDWNPAAAKVEIWSGEDAALAQLLQACLQENRIGVRREGIEPGPLRLLVMPADEAPAREIVREVRDATPPV